MKTIWGLFASYNDARAVVDEFRRRGIAPDDLSAVVPSGAVQRSADGPPARAKDAGGRGRRGQGGAGATADNREKRVPAPGATPPRSGGAAGSASSNTGPAISQPAIAGGQELRLPGLPPLIASGTLRDVLGRSIATQPAVFEMGRAATGSKRPTTAGAAQPPDVSPVAAARRPSARSQAGKAAHPPQSVLTAALAGLGLPPAYAQSYADGVSRGQILLAIRIPDQRERDAVNLMRRYRVMALAGQPEDTGRPASAVE